MVHRLVKGVVLVPLRHGDLLIHVELTKKLLLGENKFLQQKCFLKLEFTKQTEALVIGRY